MSSQPNASVAIGEGQNVHGNLIRDSHERCAALGLTRIGRLGYEPLSRSDLSSALERSHQLLTHAVPVMELLLEQIAGTHSMVALADARGTVLHTAGDEDFVAHAAKVALVPGASWAEHAKGTNAIGTALIEERPMRVQADEHFMYAHQFLNACAAPVFDLRRNLLGVLCISSDQRGCHEHTMALVRMSASMIENHWLDHQGRNRLRLHFHGRAPFIGTLLEGVVVAGADGRLQGANRSALDQLGLSSMALRNHTLASLFGTTVAAVMEHLHHSPALPMRLRLSDGHEVQVSARIDGTLLALAGAPEAAGTARRRGEPAPVRAGAQAAPAPGSAALAAPPTGLAWLRTGDPQIETVVQKARRIIDRDIPLLILGETGTGKELLAHAVHQESNRAKQPFVAVNCASIPESLIEAELFGYEEGAFTGARRKGATGRIVQANGGTLFLDEIGDMPLPLQARLLRVLQERCVTPLGSGKSIAVDIAVIGATHRNLREMIQRGEFREDLYYRLNGLVLRLPPLRERSDLPVVAQRILANECPQGAPRIGAEVMALFQRCDWPGNIRQLANVLRTAAVMAAGEPQITQAHLSDDFLEDVCRLAPQPMAAAHAAGCGALPVSDAAAQRGTVMDWPSSAAPVPPSAAAPDGVAARADTLAPAPVASALPCAHTMHEQELLLIRAALSAAGGNVSKASKRLGISRNTIYRKVRWNQPATGPR